MIRKDTAPASGPEAEAEAEALARAARENSYAPYSGYREGVALCLADGRIVAGATFENAAYMHGFTALESALCALITGRTPGGPPPAIDEIYVSAEADNPWPDLSGWGLAALLAAPEMRVVSLHADGERTSLDWRGLAGKVPAALPQAGGNPPAADPPPSAIFSGGPLRGLAAARRNAFAPVSHYRVGAMAESACGKIFYGCNIETGGNKSLHAEGNALSAMVTACGPSVKLRRMTVLTVGSTAFPCGGCRQYMNELALPETEVVLMNEAGERRSALHRDLLPCSFGNADLESAVPQE